MLWCVAVECDVGGCCDCLPGLRSRCGVNGLGVVVFVMVPFACVCGLAPPQWTRQSCAVPEAFFEVACFSACSP